MPVGRSPGRLRRFTPLPGAVRGMPRCSRTSGLASDGAVSRLVAGRPGVREGQTHQGRAMSPGRRCAGVDPARHLKLGRGSCAQRRGWFITARPASEGAGAGAALRLSALRVESSSTSWRASTDAAKLPHGMRTDRGVSVGRRWCSGWHGPAGAPDRPLQQLDGVPDCSRLSAGSPTPLEDYAGGAGAESRSGFCEYAKAQDRPPADPVLLLRDPGKVSSRKFSECFRRSGLSPECPGAGCGRPLPKIGAARNRFTPIRR
jgi:hypothetical protein